MIIQRELLELKSGGAKYKIEGITIPECHLEYYNRSTHIVTTRYYSDTKDVKRSIFEFLDDLSPLLFLLDGLIYNVIINKDYDNKDYIEIRKIGYW